MRAAEGENGILSAVAFAGTIIVAVAAAIGAAISLALAETVKDIGGTPLGFVAFLGSGVWILVVGIGLAMQARQPSPPVPSSPAP